MSNLKDINVYKCYSDDGYTGTDFNRPAFQEMMEDIREKRINCVIVKDLSRVGRNYINVGYFIDDTIPRYNLRFISVNDNIDSYLNPESKDSLDVLFKNLMNESLHLPWSLPVAPFSTPQTIKLPPILSQSREQSLRH